LGLLAEQLEIAGWNPAGHIGFATLPQSTVELAGTTMPAQVADVAGTSDAVAVSSSVRDTSKHPGPSEPVNPAAPLPHVNVTVTGDPTIENCWEEVRLATQTAG
jgi:hypothetical protein